MSTLNFDVKPLSRLKQFLFLSVAILATSSSLVTPVALAQNVNHPVWQTPDGVWWNNICRNEYAWFIYPAARAQIVGTTCTVGYGGGPGVVT